MAVDDVKWMTIERMNVLWMDGMADKMDEMADG